MIIEWITDEERELGVGVGQPNPELVELQQHLNVYVVPVIGASFPLVENGVLDAQTCEVLGRGWQNYKRIDWSTFNGNTVVAATVACGGAWPPHQQNPPAGTPHTYVVQSGDWGLVVITEKFVGGQNRFRELYAANPHRKVTSNGSFENMQPGDVYWLPATWPSVPGGPLPPVFDQVSLPPIIMPWPPALPLPPGTPALPPGISSEIPAPSWWPAGLPWPPPEPIGWLTEIPWPPALPLPPGTPALPPGINWEAVKPSWWPAEVPWPLEVPEGFWGMLPSIIPQPTTGSIEVPPAEPAPSPFPPECSVANLPDAPLLTGGLGENIISTLFSIDPEVPRKYADFLESVVPAATDTIALLRAQATALEQNNQTELNRILSIVCPGITTTLPTPPPALEPTPTTQPRRVRKGAAAAIVITGIALLGIGAAVATRRPPQTQGSER